MTSQGEVAAYVATTCLELRKMAASPELGLDLLVQLLDMAALEADNVRAAAKVPAGCVVPLKRP
ncbi:hypothetical protein [Bradyrhizobium prioriisuperbiae]|uniref:hypothetical protein n=1 Tax=Bradyrhizobium prioriisuperbiae TaxID=2854389 RepID=UPI0028E7F9C3|nr:hypothetical protein [Bradyrhizobium prioritasuperba]